MLGTRTSHKVAALAVAVTSTLLVACSSSASVPATDALQQAAPALHAPAQPLAAPQVRTAAQVTAPGDDRPNIVLISTDDETMSDMAWMPHTRELLGDAGITFDNMLSPHPLCCPARAEILTGQYAQNNGVRSNKAEWRGGFQHLIGKDQTIATWLSGSGYQTAFVGKFLNGYTAKDGMQPGWDHWNPTVKNVYGYYDYTMYNDGDPQAYTTLHNADLVGMKTVDYINEFAGTDKPFFIWASQVAPHAVCNHNHELYCNGLPRAAVRHQDLFKGLTSPSLRDPAYNEKNVSDKPHNIRKLDMEKDGFVNRFFRARIRSLQAVDEAVADTVAALKATGELDNTLILFTSDNGYLLGEHRYMAKNVPYEQALRVPLLMRGPGIPAGQERQQMVTTVDLAPTILAAAHVTATRTVDGRDITPFLTDATKKAADTVLIQAGPADKREVQLGWSYRGVRTDRYTYVYHLAEQFTELYDRDRDPAELVNVADDPRYRAVRADLAQRLADLKNCSGVSNCFRDFGATPGLRSLTRSHR